MNKLAYSLKSSVTIPSGFQVHVNVWRKEEIGDCYEKPVQDRNPSDLNRIYARRFSEIECNEESWCEY